jgi:nicotinamidase-related amidase
MKLQTSIGLVIDMQERLFPHIHDHDGLARRCSILIQGLTALGVPLIVTEQYVKGLGATIPAINDVVSEHPRFEKMTFSCCGDTTIAGALMGSARHTVIICGIEAHVCVLQTVLDLRSQGNTVVVVDDCVSSRRPHDKAIAIERMRTAGAVITTYESILFELCETSGTETFKTISRLVK